MNKKNSWLIISQFLVIMLVLIFGFSIKVRAQQFNTDNYLTMPHGTGTFVITAGQRNSTLLSSFALVPNFEFFFQANLFRDYRIENYTQHFTTTVYAKYMFWVNEANNGGAAVFLGFGRSPGYFQDTEYTELHKNIWTAIPITIPLFNNAISWDLMPGAMVDFDTKDKNQTAWGFTWSSRLAIYKVIPKTAIVAEAYGTQGQASSPAEYKIGLRWEPNDFIVPAISYSSQFRGGYGAGLEIGIVIFSPQFLKKDFIKSNHMVY
ncbi:hypothetical protein E4S40_06265 [Algoriphagus kandeliae]|uniref:Uncharacterized protein n=1 Tax=Algoriphagus kandeliae TaxID=2562278 RepID=A0A4Y9QX47_9BACT|nr:hypothetical protein [Algoriphagus kandeliae]TFV95823.1 hypothetical protein E4S40_06265 [Algoriphagus kandeliae]